MSFDEIFDLTAGVYFNFYNIFQTVSMSRKRSVASNSTRLEQRASVEDRTRLSRRDLHACCRKKNWRIVDRRQLPSQQANTLLHANFVGNGKEIEQK